MRRGDRRPPFGRKPAHVLRRAVRRPELLECQSHQRRLQEPADGRRQGSERGRHLRCGAGTAGDLRADPPRRRGRLDDCPSEEGRQRRGRPGSDRPPSRLGARGGVGAVMGSKKVKAIVAELDKMPTLQDRPKVMSAVREYGKRLRADQTIENFRLFGTASMADYTNLVGGPPGRNFSARRLTPPA